MTNKLDLRYARIKRACAFFGITAGNPYGGTTEWWCVPISIMPAEGKIPLSLGKICFRNGKFSHCKFYHGVDRYIRHCLPIAITDRAFVKCEFFDAVIKCEVLAREREFVDLLRSVNYNLHSLKKSQQSPKPIHINMKKILCDYGSALEYMGSHSRN